jgi:type VI secretion system secreted protein Hcp
MKLFRFFRILPLALTLSFAGQIFAQSSSSTSTVYMTVTGQKQGLIKGEVTQKGRENQHKLLAYSHEIVSPTDPASGLPTGKRQHQPFRIVKLLNQGSPGLFSAMVQNENLTSVVIDVWSPGVAGGTEVKLMTYKLTNARIISLRPWMPNRSDASAQSYPPAEEIAFAYQKIEVTFVPTGTTASDDWESPVN